MTPKDDGEGYGIVGNATLNSISVKPKYPEITTDLSGATDKLYDNVVSKLMNLKKMT